MSIYFPPSNAYYCKVNSTAVAMTTITTKTTINSSLKVDYSSSSVLTRNLKDRVCDLKEVKKELDEARSFSGQALIGLGVVGGLLLIAAGVAAIAAVFFVICIIPDVNLAILLGHVPFFLIAGGCFAIESSVSYIPELEEELNSIKVGLERQLTTQYRATSNKAEFAELQEALNEAYSFD